MSAPLNVEERMRLGQERRKQIRRLGHQEWNANKRREDPLKLLERSVRGRVPKLIELKNELMSASPFGFYRGAVPVMAYDLSIAPNTGICNQLCGDAHVRNLGAFAGSSGRLFFDINDFDETIVGPFEWDVKRMATSLILAGREGGTKDLQCREAAMIFLERYRTTMAVFARMPVLDVARFQVHRLRNVGPIAGILRVAERATPVRTLQSLTVPRVPESKHKTSGATSTAPRPHARAPKPGLGNGSRVFKEIPNKLWRVTGEAAHQVIQSLRPYAATLQPELRHFLAQYTPEDVAFKVVGTGSVGLRDYCVYMTGNGGRDPLFLQIKEEVASGYAPYATGFGNRKEHEGRRVVNGERAMQLQSDPFLGWTTMEGRDYLVRQLNDHKASIQLAELRRTELLEYAAVCGEMLARGHARAGDSAMITGYLGRSARFDNAITSFAEAYADQTDRDWQELVRSRKGRAVKKTVPAKKTPAKRKTTVKH